MKHQPTFEPVNKWVKDECKPIKEVKDREVVVKLDPAQCL